MQKVSLLLLVINLSIYAPTLDETQPHISHAEMLTHAEIDKTQPHIAIHVEQAVSDTFKQALKQQTLSKQTLSEKILSPVLSPVYKLSDWLSDFQMNKEKDNRSEDTKRLENLGMAFLIFTGCTIASAILIHAHVLAPLIAFCTSYFSSSPLGMDIIQAINTTQQQPQQSINVLPQQHHFLAQDITAAPWATQAPGFYNPFLPYMQCSNFQPTHTFQEINNSFWTTNFEQVQDLINVFGNKTISQAAYIFGLLGPKIQFNTINRLVEALQNCNMPSNSLRLLHKFFKNFTATYSQKEFNGGQTCQNYDQYRECTNNPGSNAPAAVSTITSPPTAVTTLTSTTTHGCSCIDYTQVCAPALSSSLLQSKFCRYTLSAELSRSLSGDVSSSRTVRKLSRSKTVLGTQSLPVPRTHSGSRDLTVSHTFSASASHSFTPVVVNATWSILNNFNSTANNPWVQVIANGASGSPAARYRYAIVIDSVGVLWLFGGYDGSSGLNDLWKYATTTSGPWTQVIANGVSGSPVARSRHAMVINSAGMLWMFGGLSVTYLNDLWKYNTATSGPWTQVIADGVSGSPAARYGHAMVIDSAGMLWLFGGIYSDTGRMNDLWKYPTTTSGPWVQIIATGLSGSPAARDGHKMIINSAGMIWLFGGWAGVSGVLNDLWRYNTASSGPWQQIIADGVSGSPSARSGSAMVINSAGLLWLFSGSGSAYYDDLWKYNTATTGPWTQIIANGVSGSPAGRYGHAMVIDSTGMLLVFGGINSGGISNDLWKYSEQQLPVTSFLAIKNIINPSKLIIANDVTPAPVARGYQAMTISPDGIIWLFGGRNGAVDFNDLWKYPTATSGPWTQVIADGVSGSPTKRYIPTMITTSTSILWMFAGYNGSYLNDLWKYNTATSGPWTQVIADGLSGSPSGRGSHTMVIDSAGILWIFGGAGSSTFNDLWKYPTASSGPWTQVIADGVSGSPGARSGSAMVIDSAGMIWLSGGTASINYNDLWKYPTTTSGPWTQVIAQDTNGSPSLGYYSAMGINSANEIWLFGGTAGNSNSLWIYNTVTSGPWTQVIAPQAIGSPSVRSPFRMLINSTGMAWIFGGLESNGFYLNDLYRYPTLSSWQTALANGASGSPAKRNDHAMVITSTGIMWLFGGTNSSGRLNDLWRYNSTTPNTWQTVIANGVSGSPAIRSRPAMVVDSNGVIWLFGGANSVYYNDLWKYPTATSGPWTQIIADGVSGSPSQRNDHAIVITSAGMIWLFGGYDGGSGLNDLWKYATTTSGPWTQVIANGLSGSPVARSRHAMVITSTGVLWLFGGYSGSYLNDLWKYATATSGPWTQVIANGVSSSPSIRCWYTIAIDSADVLWMFAGYNGGSFFNDLWKYNTASSGPWTQILSTGASGSPAIRALHTMVINSAGLLFMFGGNGAGVGNFFNDLSTYNTAASVNKWQMVLPNSSPVIRSEHTMVINPSNGLAWMFGGYSTSYLNDLWRYNTATADSWMQVVANGASSSPAARDAHTMVIDSAGMLWVFGGSYTGGRLNDLWRYNTATFGPWTQVIANAVIGSPAQRYYNGMVIDSAGVLLVFGGNSNTGYLNDLWRYNTTSTVPWQQIIADGVSGSPAKRGGHAMAIDSIGVIWMFGGNNGGSYFNDLWRYNSATAGPWMQILANGASGSPAARSEEDSIVISSAGMIWLFGGWTGSASLNDLWIYNTATSGPWQQVLPNGVSGSPAARKNHAIVIDSANILYIFAGSTGSTSLNDLWSINTNSITPLQTKEFMQVSWEAAQTPYTLNLTYSPKYFDGNTPASAQITQAFTTSSNTVLVPAPTQAGNHSIIFRLLNKLSSSANTTIFLQQNP